MKQPITIISKPFKAKAHIQLSKTEYGIIKKGRSGYIAFSPKK